MRIGVFVCHCGSNIAGTVDCKAAAESALALPDVVYATDLMYTCAEPGQAAYLRIIVDYGTQRMQRTVLLEIVLGNGYRSADTVAAARMLISQNPHR